MKVTEYNIDGLIGPTHFFGGLGAGNIASEQSAGNVSNPKAAALQGLLKMKAMHDRGIKQLIMPPHPRPALFLFQDKGYTNPADIITVVKQHEPKLIPIIYSSSAMWTANAATISPSADTKDGKIHITPANLVSNPHRNIESSFTEKLLKKIFIGDSFVHHLSLPNTPEMKDEGAANHMRVLPKNAAQGVEIFVYGDGGKHGVPQQYAARQHLNASIHIATQHQLENTHTIFVQQHPQAIDAGVFHNDVIATSNENAIFYHEMAFAHEPAFTARIEAIGGLQLFRVSSEDLPLEQAVATYLFNSQIVTKPDGAMLLLAPRQCEQSDNVQRVVMRWLTDANCPINEVIYTDVDQSMANGGGPACLRLRLWLSEAEARQLHPGVAFTDARYEQLNELIERDYPDEISADDLQNPDFPLRVLPIYPKLAALFEMPDLYDGWF